ncbi:hypothetical protein HK098_003227 [Nowakowskiella sp. JEL0407]|nr:hypothetical protein HK098_003227 [Nowakowskiella sp. JEL0407]
MTKYSEFINKIRPLSIGVPQSQPPKLFNYHLATTHPFPDISPLPAISLIPIKSQLHETLAAQKQSSLNLNHVTDIPFPRVIQSHIIDPSKTLFVGALGKDTPSQDLQKIAGFRIQINGKRGTRAAKTVVHYGSMSTGDVGRNYVDYAKTCYTDKKGSTGVQVWVSYKR